MFIINFNNTRLILNHKQLYRAIYYSYLESYMSLFSGYIKNEDDFEKAFYKASRLANITAVKTLSDRSSITTKTFLGYLEDLNSMGSLYKKDELELELEECQGNKYIVNLYNKKEEYLVDNFVVYAPNYNTALKRAKELTLCKTPKEL